MGASRYQLSGTPDQNSFFLVVKQKSTARFDFGFVVGLKSPSSRPDCPRCPVWVLQREDRRVTTACQLSAISIYRSLSQDAVWSVLQTAPVHPLYGLYLRRLPRFTLFSVLSSDHCAVRPQRRCLPPFNSLELWSSCTLSSVARVPRP